MIDQICNKELRITDESGSFICVDVDQYNTILINEKDKIKRRMNILERFEHWELTGATDEWVNQLRRILISRCVNESEEKLVTRYIKLLKEA